MSRRKSNPEQCSSHRKGEQNLYALYWFHIGELLGVNNCENNAEKHATLVTIIQRNEKLMQNERTNKNINN